MNTVKDITKIELNNDSLKNNVFKQIADSNENEFVFVSKESKQSIKKYIDTKNLDISLAKEVWKNLLIDSISMLKINDSRERLYGDSINHTKELLENFSHIRKTSSYGIDEIDKYFNDFIDFEAVLYGMNKQYRDHINHVLQVWAIGIGLIDHAKFKLNDNFELDINTNFHFEIKDDETNKDKKISKIEFFAMWTIIALCHDLGYPIEKASQINKQTKKIITYFGNMQFTELDYSFSIFNTFLVEKFLNIISSKVTPVLDGKSENLKTNQECMYQTSIQTKYRDKLSKSLEDYKHGAVVAQFGRADSGGLEKLDS
ncbi:MAG: hypothetical protein LBG80_12255 [Bacteroidales bacterium]|jgi:hypothetical protein|nr:hypothetical protein [Bacteroidales bacterium]